MNAYAGYTITKAPDTGLQIVRFNGVKIGSSQTEPAARIIRRRHAARQNTNAS